VEWFDLTGFLTTAVPIGVLIAWFIKRLDRRFDVIDAKFEKIDLRFDRIDKQMTDIRKEISTIDTNLCEEISTVEKRLLDRMDDLYQKQSMEINAMSVRIGHIESALFPTA